MLQTWSEAEPGTREWLGLVLLAASLLVSLLYLTTPPVFDAEDWVKLHSINQDYLVRSLGQGRLPLWNPYVAMGRPFLADIEVAAFYPPHLLFAVLPSPLALVVLLVGHVGLLLGGMLLLGRSFGMSAGVAWLVAGALAASGVVVEAVHTGQVRYGEAVCWLPLLFWLAARLADRFEPRRLGLLAVGLALQFLCGHPQAAWVTWFGLALFLVGRSVSLRGLTAGLASLACALALASSLTACQLLPFLELVGQSNRGTPSPGFSATGSIDWTGWLTLVVPSWPGTRFGVDFYLGAVPLLAGIAGFTRLANRNTRGLALMAVGALLFTLGEHTPAWPLFYNLLPGVSSFRFPGRAGLLVCFALALMAGEWLSTRNRSGRVAIALAGTLLTAAGSWWASSLDWGGGAPWPWLWPVLCAVSTVVLLTWTASARGGERASRAVAYVVVGCVAGGALLNCLVHKPFRRTVTSYPGERLLAAALSQPGVREPGGMPPRVMVPFPLIRDNSGMIYGYSNVAGYGSLTLASVWVYLHEALGLRPPNRENTFAAFEIYDRGPFALPQAGVALGLDPVAARVVPNPEPAPRVWLASQVEQVRDIHEAVARLRDGQPPDVVTLFPPVSGWTTGDRTPSVSPAASDGTRITRFEPERIEIETRTSVQAMLVIAEAWYPGWSATVDGVPAECRPANGWMRAVAIRPGSRRVVLEYRSRWLVVGACVSTLGLVLVLVLLRPHRRGTLARRTADA